MRLTLIVLALASSASTATGQSYHRAKAPAPQPGTIFLYPERVPQRDGSLATAERGMLFVPVNRADTAAGVIGIDLWRFAATEPSSLPPIVLLHGGPGWPGLDASLENFDYWDEVIAMFTGVTDLLVIGQRGIGSSKPNTMCEGGLPYAASQTCRAYWDERGLDLSGFTVLEAAADVRDAAHALGYDSVIVWGGSFGSHWGMTVIRNYPDLVARAVLRGMEGPDHTYDSPTGVWNAITRYAAEAEQSPEVRALFPEGSILVAIDSIRARLSQGVVRASAPHPETGADETMTFNVFQVPGLIDGYTSSIASRSRAAGWPADIYRLYQGDFESVVAARLEAAAASSGQRLYRTASYFMLDCGSGITSERLERYKNDPAIPYVGDRSVFYQSACPAWKSDLGDAFRANFDTDVPTAIVNGDRDMSTPYENALELAPHFKRGKLVTVVGGSHGALREAMEADDAFRTAIFDFVRTGDLGVLPDSVVLPPVAWELPQPN